MSLSMSPLTPRSSDLHALMGLVHQDRDQLDALSRGVQDATTAAAKPKADEASVGLQQLRERCEQVQKAVTTHREILGKVDAHYKGPAAVVGRHLGAIETDLTFVQQGITHIGEVLKMRAEVDDLETQMGTVKDEDLANLADTLTSAPLNEMPLPMAAGVFAHSVRAKHAATAYETHKKEEAERADKERIAKEAAEKELLEKEAAAKVEKERLEKEAADLAEAEKVRQETLRVAAEKAQKEQEATLGGYAQFFTDFAAANGDIVKVRAAMVHLPEAAKKEIAAQLQGKELETGHLVAFNKHMRGLYEAACTQYGVQPTAVVVTVATAVLPPLAPVHVTTASVSLVPLVYNNGSNADFLIAAAKQCEQLKDLPADDATRVACVKAIHGGVQKLLHGVRQTLHTAIGKAAGQKDTEATNWGRIHMLDDLGGFAAVVATLPVVIQANKLALATAAKTVTKPGGDVDALEKDKKEVHTPKRGAAKVTGHDSDDEFDFNADSDDDAAPKAAGKKPADLSASAVLPPHVPAKVVKTDPATLQVVVTGSNDASTGANVSSPVLARTGSTDVEPPKKKDAAAVPVVTRAVSSTHVDPSKAKKGADASGAGFHRAATVTAHSGHTKGKAALTAPVSSAADEEQRKKKAAEAADDDLVLPDFFETHQPKLPTLAVDKLKAVATALGKIKEESTSAAAKTAMDAIFAPYRAYKLQVVYAAIGTEMAGKSGADAEEYGRTNFGQNLVFVKALIRDALAKATASV